MRKISSHLGLFSLASLLCLSFMTADLANAKDRREDGRPEIQLTAEQREKAKSIMEQYRERTRGTREALKAKNEELRALMHTANPDVSKVEALCSEIGVLQGKRLIEKFNVRQELINADLPPQLADRKGGKPGKGDRKGKRDRKDDKRD